MPFSVLLDALESGTEDDVLGVTGNGAFILSPEERPVVEVLEVVWLTEEQSRCYVTWDGREVGAVVTVEHLLRTGSTHGSYK